jgi:hypothetical protein
MQVQVEKDFRALCDMFESDGWKVLMSEVSNLERGITEGAVDNCPTSDQWQYTRGQLHQLRSLTGYETFVRLSFKEQEDDDSV